MGASSDDYWAAANACMKVPKCIGITTWGVGDRVSKPLLPHPLLPARVLVQYGGETLGEKKRIMIEFIGSGS